MRRLKKRAGGTATGLILSAMLLIVPVGVSAEGDIEDHIGHKLLRGMTNTLTGWLEIPRLVYLRTAEGPIVLGTVQGLVEGVGMGFARTSAGLYEVVTFAVPVPGHYGPLFEPEFVWDSVDDEQGLSLRDYRPGPRPRLLEDEDR